MSIGLGQMTNKIYCFSASGYELANKLLEFMDGEIYYSKKSERPIRELVGEQWKLADNMIFIGATGIAVRYIAPHLIGKEVDPAVVVLDDVGKHVISLLSGHLGGANALAEKIAFEIGGTPVITTASDNRNFTGIDMFAQANNLEIEDLKSLIGVSSAMVDGELIGFYSEVDMKLDYENVIYLTSLENICGDLKAVVIVSSKKVLPELEVPTGVLRPKSINLGIGCRRDTDSEKLYDFVKSTLAELNISAKSVKAIGSIDIKSDEEAILHLGEEYKTGVVFFSADELSAVDHLFKGSDFVRETVGVGSVSATAATLLGGAIILEKKALDGMTISITKEI